MVDFILFLFRVIGFFVFILSLPLTVGFILYDVPGVIIAGVATLFLFFIDSLRTDIILTKELRPTSVSLQNRVIYKIEDASSHVFITRSPWFGKIKIWVTRGSFSLLKHEDLLDLIKNIESRPMLVHLGFETYITTHVLRLTRKLPNALVSLLFKSESSSRDLPVSKTLFSLPILGLLSFFSVLYRPSKETQNENSELCVAVKKIRDESTICIPNLNPALSNHALINPWPHALMYWGRPCLDYLGRVSS